MENAACLSVKEMGADTFDIVTPSLPIPAEPNVVDKRGTRKVASAYHEYPYSPESHEIAAKNFHRPNDAGVFDQIYAPVSR